MDLKSRLSALPRPLLNRVIVLTLAALATVICLQLLPRASALNRMVGKMDSGVYDSLFTQRGPEHSLDDFLIVQIDKTSIQNVSDLNPGVGYPFPRSLHAKLIDNLKRAGARLVAMDITFAGDKPGQDEPFARSLKAAGNTILAADFSTSGTSEADQAASSQDVPTPILRDAALAIAPADIPKDEVDDTVRRFQYLFKHMSLDDPTRDDMFPSFAATIAGAARGITGERLLRELKSHRFDGAPIPAAPDSWTSNGVGQTAWCCFPGPPRVFRYIGYDQVLAMYDPASNTGVGAGRADPSDIKGKIVLVGETDPESHDVLMTPTVGGRSENRSGVEVQACIAHTLLSHHAYAPFPEAGRVLLGWLLAFATAMLTLWLRPFRGGMVTLLLLLGLTALVISLFHARIFLRPTEIASSAAASYLLNTVYLYLTEERRAREARRHFGRFIGPQAMEWVLNRGQTDLGGEMRYVSIVFTDVQGFTSLSEKMTPEEAVKVLNRYLTRMVDCIFKYEGTLDKIMGDGIMAYFGAPVELENPNLQAVLCAIEMQQLMREWRRESEDDPELPPLNKRIGIHCGQVIWGEIGSANQVGLTLIGDPVNVAARLEPLNKEYDTEILVSEQVQEHLPEWIRTEYRGPVNIRGRKEVVHAYSIEVPDSMPHEARNIRSKTPVGLRS